MFNVKCVFAILKFITSKLEKNAKKEAKKITKHRARLVKRNSRKAALIRYITECCSKRDETQSEKIRGHQVEVQGSTKLVKNINKFME